MWLGIIWLVLWSGFTLAFDGLIGWVAYRQLRAESYPSVIGVVTRSEVCDFVVCTGVLLYAK